MQFLYYALFAAGIVAVDQLSKYFTVAYIPLYTDISFIPGVLNLTYVQNSGAAFSSFEGQQWLFALIFLFFTGLIVWEYFKKKMAFTPFERWCIAAIYGGGLANMVDRLRMGYVVDMIETLDALDDTLRKLNVPLKGQLRMIFQEEVSQKGLVL